MRRKVRLLALRSVMFEPQTLMEAVRWSPPFKLCLHSSPCLFAEVA